MTLSTLAAVARIRKGNRTQSHCLVNDRKGNILRFCREILITNCCCRYKMHSTKYGIAYLAFNVELFDGLIIYKCVLMCKYIWTAFHILVALLISPLICFAFYFIFIRYDTELRYANFRSKEGMIKHVNTPKIETVLYC